MLKILTLFILHTGHGYGGMVQAISCLQLHILPVMSHFSLPAMALTALLSHSDALCASATAANNATRKLLFHLCMFSCDSDHFHPWPYHPVLGRRQADERAEQHHKIPHPHPRRQRIHVALQYHSLIVVLGSAEIDVQILVETVPNRHFRIGLLGDRVKPPLRMHL